MDHIDSGLRGILKYSVMYDFFLRIIGYHNAMKILSDEYILAKYGQKILDVGCGSSLILNWLPDDIIYSGYDLNNNYISHNQKKYPQHNFYCNRVSDMAIVENNSYDIAIAISLIHHINDLEVGDLFDSVHKALKPGGRFVTYDPVWTYSEGKIEYLIKKNDRGQHIRDSQQLLKFASKDFNGVDIHIRKNMGWYFPATVAIMVCRKEL